MLTEATKEIISIANDEEERKKSLRRILLKLQNRKQIRESEFSNDNQLFNRVDLRTGNTSNYSIVRFIGQLGRAISSNNQIKEHRKQFVRSSNAVGEILHWTSMSEHRSITDRKRAVGLAKKSANI